MTGHRLQWSLVIAADVFHRPAVAQFSFVSVYSSNHSGTGAYLVGPAAQAR